MKKFKNLYAITHRGDETTSLGIYSKIPLILKNLSPNALLVLAYIDIDQFKDKVYLTTGFKQAIRVELMASILGLSRETVKRAIKELKGRKLIKVLKRKGDADAYISNMLKFKIKYQIFTLTFLARNDISILSKSFIIKLLMLNTDRVNNIANISALSEEIEMSRNSIYKVFSIYYWKSFVY